MSDDKTKQVTAFWKAAQWSGVLSSDRKNWLAERKALITASDIPAIMGEDHFRSNIDCYCDKRMPAVEERIELDDARFWGSVMEQPMLQAVAEYHGWDYRPGGALLVSREHPIMGATLDAEIDRHDGYGWIPMEGKTSEMTAGWDEDTQTLPARVVLQVQCQLLVSKAPMAFVFALLRRYQPVQIVVKASPELQRIILEYGQWFMDLVNRRAYDELVPNGTARDARAIARLFPNADKEMGILLPPEAVAWTRELQEISAKQLELEKRETELKNLVRLCMGPASYGILPEQVGKKSAWGWKNEPREASVRAASNARVLRQLKEAPKGLTVATGINYQELLAAKQEEEKQLEGTKEP
jgi:putative phage-type endonuclease